MSKLQSGRQRIKEEIRKREILNLSQKNRYYLYERFKSHPDPREVNLGGQERQITDDLGI